LRLQQPRDHQSCHPDEGDHEANAQEAHFAGVCISACFINPIAILLQFASKNRIVTRIVGLC
jgi:hypothetical protein